jgi:hypothetical protein
VVASRFEGGWYLDLIAGLDPALKLPMAVH